MQHTQDLTGNPLQNPYEQEARERWGHTDAWKQSQERVNKMTKEDMRKIQEEGSKLLQEIAQHIGEDPASPTVQTLIQKHYEGLRHFYEPSLEMYRGLGNLYVDDARFTATFEKVAPGLAAFMRDAMRAYCDNQQK